MPRRPILVIAGLALGVALIGAASGAPRQSSAAAAPLPAQAAAPTPVPSSQAPASASTGTASADPEADTTSASINLHAGFILDPYILPVVGNGQTAASTLKEGCNGFVGAAPDVTIHWSGEAEQLSYFVYSDGDPVLVVRQPDGSILCNDDAGLATTQPLVVVKTPAEGAYEIFVGAARRDEPALGVLGVTAMSLDDATLADLDLRPMLTRRGRPQEQPAPRLDPAALLTGRPAIFGARTLQPGFEPVRTFAAGGGDIAAFTVQDKQLVCAGFVGLVPSYSFTWQGESEPIRLFFEARKDSSLAVITPDQQVLCNMNAGKDNLNPALDIAEPSAGRYKVYIAGMEPNGVVAGRLTITSAVGAAPAVLTPAVQ